MVIIIEKSPCFKEIAFCFNCENYINNNCKIKNAHVDYDFSCGDFDKKVNFELVTIETYKNKILKEQKIQTTAGKYTFKNGYVLFMDKPNTIFLNNENMQFIERFNFKEINMKLFRSIIKTLTDLTIIKNTDEEKNILKDVILRDFRVAQAALISELIDERDKKNIIDLPCSELLNILKDPKLFWLLSKSELDKVIVGEEATRKVILLCSFGRLVTNAYTASYNLFVNSDAGSGKDYVTTKTLLLQPTDKTIKRTRISPTAFTYWHNAMREPQWTWNGKICYLEDISSDVMNHEVFKVMCSEGSSTTIVIDHEAVDIIVNGKPVMIVTSATASPNPELTRRFAMVNLDESIDQTEEIMKRHAKYATHGKKIEFIQDILRAISFLNNVKVKVPYAEAIVRHIPKNSIIMRTHFTRFLDYIKASTALHQFQREKDSEGFYLATGLDYDIARDCIINITSNKYMIPLTKVQKKIIDTFVKLPKIPYSTTDLEVYISFVSERQLRRELDRLVNYGLLDKGKQERINSRREVMVYSLLSFEGDDIPNFEQINKNKENEQICAELCQLCQVGQVCHNSQVCQISDNKIILDRLDRLDSESVTINFPILGFENDKLSKSIGNSCRIMSIMTSKESMSSMSSMSNDNINSSENDKKSVFLEEFIESDEEKVANFLKKQENKQCETQILIENLKIFEEILDNMLKKGEIIEPRKGLIQLV